MFLSNNELKGKWDKIKPPIALLFYRMHKYCQKLCMFYFFYFCCFIKESWLTWPQLFSFMYFNSFLFYICISIMYWLYADMGIKSKCLNILFFDLIFFSFFFKYSWNLFVTIVSRSTEMCKMFELKLTEWWSWTYFTFFIMLNSLEKSEFQLIWKKLSDRNFYTSHIFSYTHMYLDITSENNIKQILSFEFLIF